MAVHNKKFRIFSRIFLNGNISSVNCRSLNLLILVYILFKMKIILYVHCYRQDPLKKVTYPDPRAQKSTDPTGSGSSSLVITKITIFPDSSVQIPTVSVIIPGLASSSILSLNRSINEQGCIFFILPPPPAPGRGKNKSYWLVGEKI